jgi:hypothetical protein
MSERRAFPFYINALKIFQDFLRTFQVNLNFNRWMLSALAASAMVVSL